MLDLVRRKEAAFKLKVVEFAEKNSNRGAGRHFGVDEKRVREWRKQKEQLESLPRKKRRMDGGGRKAALPEILRQSLAHSGLTAQREAITFEKLLHPPSTSTNSSLPLD